MNEATIAPARHKLDVDAYHRMGDAGIFAPEDRVELIDGEIFDMAPIGQDHAATVTGLNETLFLACAGRAIVSPQNPVRLNRYSEPQPDFAVLKPRPDRYRTGAPPGPADTLLLIEVSDSTLDIDRKIKLPLYARAGIGEYWIINLKDRVFEAYRSPAGDGYDETTTHQAKERLALSLAPEIIVQLELAFG